MTIKLFQKTIWDYYKKYGRVLPWRLMPESIQAQIDPYKIFVSEVMLQQTQVSRVLTKYPEFIKAFPTFRALSRASLTKILRVWQGMGYNRRALYLQRSAKIIMDRFGGNLPQDVDMLQELPGIGAATAASIVAFTFNKPTIFIETNIRRAFIHFFFSKVRRMSIRKIHDNAIMPLIARTLDVKNPRTWYWALMDYGAMLGRTVSNPNRKSMHHTKQSKFEGSDRQLRGALMRLVARGVNNKIAIEKSLARFSSHRIDQCLQKLKKEGFLITRLGKYFIKNH